MEQNVCGALLLSTAELSKAWGSKKSNRNKRRRWREAFGKNCVDQWFIGGLVTRRVLVVYARRRRDIGETPYKSIVTSTRCVHETLLPESPICDQLVFRYLLFTSAFTLPHFTYCINPILPSLLLLSPAYLCIFTLGCICTRNHPGPNDLEDFHSSSRHVWHFCWRHFQIYHTCSSE